MALGWIEFCMGQRSEGHRIGAERPAGKCLAGMRRDTAVGVERRRTFKMFLGGKMTRLANRLPSGKGDPEKSSTN